VQLRTDRRVLCVGYGLEIALVGNIVGNTV